MDFFLNNQPDALITYIPAHKTHGDFFVRDFRKK